MARQHYVPQQVIRRHANASGHLWELIKPNLALSTRPRSPSGVLWRDDAYSDSEGDIDTEKYQSLEQEFATAYPQLEEAIALEAMLPPVMGERTLRWGCYLYTRGTLFDARIAAHPSCRYLSDSKRRTFVNAQRLLTARSLFSAFWRRGFAGMMIGTTDAHPFVLSDCGAVAFSLDVDAVPDDSKRLLLIPINSRVLLVYGHCDVLPCLQMVPLVQINALLFAYAARSAFCASREGLETVSEYVGTPNPQANPEWQAWARLPSFNQAARAQGASMPVLWLSYPIRAQTET